MLFNGEYEHSIDSQKRLAIPAEIRSRMERKGMSAAFFLVPMPDGSIWLWPEDTFERLAGALEGTLVPGEDLQEFDATMFPLSRYSALDSAGRIRMPEHMIAEAGLGANVVILGVRDHLEIRDPETYAAARSDRIARHAEIMQRARIALRQQSGQPRGEDTHERN